MVQMPGDKKANEAGVERPQGRKGGTEVLGEEQTR